MIDDYYETQDSRFGDTDTFFETQEEKFRKVDLKDNCNIKRKDKKNFCKVNMHKLKK